MKGNETTSEEVYLCVRNNLFLNTRSNSADTEDEPDFAHRINCHLPLQLQNMPQITLLFLNCSSFLLSSTTNLILKKWGEMLYFRKTLHGSKSDTALKL